MEPKGVTPLERAIMEEDLSVKMPPQQYISEVDNLLKESSLYRIHIEPKKGNKITIYCEEDDRVEDIKEKIFILTAIPMIHQHLSFKSTILENGNTIGQYHIPNGSTLNI